MAERPVFVPLKKAPYTDIFPIDFQWNPGLAVSQKQKNITALHAAFNRRFPERKVLEISSKSLQPEGVALSAFNLKKFVPSMGRSVPVECIYQGGKVFAAGGPYTDLYESHPRDAKRDSRLKESGDMKSFCFEGEMLPLRPMTAFYDWLYINALTENPELAAKVLEYDGFTDIEYNSQKSLNCQARAAAMFVALHREGLLDKVANYGEFLMLYKR